MLKPDVQASTNGEITEKTKRDLIITGLVGLCTGALFGVPLSIAAYLGWKNKGLNGSKRWWAWAATGIIGAPISVAIGHASGLVPTTQDSSIGHASGLAPTTQNSSIGKGGQKAIQKSIPRLPKQATLVKENTIPPVAENDFKAFLPSEDTELRSFLLADGTIEGFSIVNRFWVGKISRDELVSRGFFVNPRYKHVGKGEGDRENAKGACSPIGFNGRYMCGKGSMAAYQWGIQLDSVIASLNVLEEVWGKR
jgi:hypothetical protein